MPRRLSLGLSLGLSLAGVAAPGVQADERAGVPPPTEARADGGVAREKVRRRAIVPVGRESLYSARRRASSWSYRLVLTVRTTRAATRRALPPMRRAGGMSESCVGRAPESRLSAAAATMRVVEELVEEVVKVGARGGARVAAGG